MCSIVWVSHSEFSIATVYMDDDLNNVFLAVNNKEESKKASEKISKLTKELKMANSTIKTLEEELQKAIVSMASCVHLLGRFVPAMLLKIVT